MVASFKMTIQVLLSFLSPTAHSAEGLLLLDFLSFCDNLKPCDWSDCPKACLSLVGTGTNVLEEGHLLGSRGENAFYSPSLHRLVLTDPVCSNIIL